MPHDTAPSPTTDLIVERLRAAFVSLHAAGVRSRDIYSHILRETLVANTDLLAAWTVWEPDAFDGRDRDFAETAGHDATGRFITCWHRARGQIERVPVGGYHSPTEGDWYWMPKRRLAPCQLAPMDYQYGCHPVRITGRISPLIIEGKFHGAVGVDFRAPPAARSQPARSPHTRQQPFTSPLLNSKIAQLSPREHEVLHWLSQGKSNIEIAMILGISSHTVKNHVGHIFEKLGVHNRYEAMLAVA
jgi:DNA-binding CsgD family transcriptional regulator